MVEGVWQEVSASLTIPAPPRTHVILADQSELANGSATPLPRNTIFLTSAAPSGSEFIGRSPDWLRLVFIHEFTHIVHLDRAKGWARAGRAVFGRIPLSFPNLFLPTWQIEGLASWQESELTGEGRGHAGDFLLIEHEAARVGRLEPIDRVNGGLIDWPGGQAPYAYGLGFHEYLADRFGAATVGRLANATAGRLPFFGSTSFRTVYGESLGTLWAAYRSELEANASRSLPSERTSSGVITSATRLTHHGQRVTGPRFVPDCGDCVAEVVYSVLNPDSFPSLRSIAVDGSQPKQLTERYLGSTTGAGADLIVFDQQEYRRNTGVYSDLYVRDRRTGRQQQLTRESRVEDPDLSPDGQTIVAVRERRGRRELVLIPLHAASLGATAGAVPAANAGDSPMNGGSGLEWTVGPISTLISEAETQFNAPRWSPDGRFIAVARRRLGALSDIVVVDPRDGRMRAVAFAPSTRIVTPAWRPDGGALIAARDDQDRPFDLFEFAADGSTPAGRRLTALPGGANWPDLSSDGHTIVFVGYTVDGFDLFTMPYPAAVAEVERREPQPWSAAGTAPPTDDENRAPGIAYSPLATLAPTSWSPLVESKANQLRAGLIVAGSDVLARHRYAASATWLVNGPNDARGADAASPDWQAAYTYDRWRPSFFATASRETAFAAGSPDAAGRPTRAVRRSLDTGGGTLYAIRHARATHRALGAVLRTSDGYTFSDRSEDRTRNAVRAGWASSTARTYGYSISQEQGVTIGATTEFAAAAGDRAATATTVTVDGRGYFAGLGTHHVVALRGAAGRSNGDRSGMRIFHLGGANAGSDVIDFGYQAFSLLRGFPSDSFAGSRVAVINGEYRFPIAWPQRGVGTLPVFLRNVHATVFGDTGHAWSGRFRIDDIKTSAGGELSIDVVAGYSLPITITGGAAWGRDGVGAVSGGTVYARVGRAF